MGTNVPSLAKKKSLPVTVESVSLSQLFENAFILQLKSGSFLPRFETTRVGEESVITLFAEMGVRWAAGALPAQQAEWTALLQQRYPFLSRLDLTQPNNANRFQLARLHLSTPVRPRVRFNTGQEIAISLSPVTPVTEAQPVVKSSEQKQPQLTSKVMPSEAKAVMKPSKPAQSTEVRSASLYALDTQGPKSLKKAWHLFRTGKLDKARRELTSVKILSPEGHYLLALMDTQAGQFGHALHQLEGESNLPPEARQLQAQLYLQTHEANKALSLLNALPERSAQQVLLGQAYESQRQLKKAEAAYGRSLQLDDSNLLAHYRLGRLAMKQKRWALAQTELEWLLRLRPRDPGALTALAFVYQRQKRFDEARALYEQAFKPSSLYNYAHVLEQQSENPEAVLAARLSKQLNEAQPKEHSQQAAPLDLQLGELFSRLNDREAAKAAYQAYLEDAGPDAPKAKAVKKKLKVLDQESSRSQQALRQSLTS